MKDSSKEENLFIQQNELLFKKYKPIKLIGKGTFSNVYLAINLKTSNYVAIKAEKKNNNGVELLESEAYLLYSLRGFGIPEVLSYGRTKTHNILVLPLLGKSLLDMFIYKNKNINIDDICLLAIQILERIEWIHSNNIVYRDIKPENFLFGKKDPEVLYLIDFGLCRKYKSSTTGKHIKPKNLGKFTGTSRYASLYAMAGNEQSRRDDIESIGYMIIFLMKKRLPWQGIKGNSYKECYHKLYIMKKYIEIEELCKGLPGEIVDYMNNARSLKFEEEPNYQYLKDLFNNILKKHKFNFDRKIFSWVDKIEISENIAKSNSMGKLPSNNRKIRKSSPQNRLFNKIKKSIENKKNLIPINANIKKINQNNENSDQFSLNLRNNNNISNSKDEKYNKSINYINYKVKKGNSSELSNTLKVMYNKNINSGYNENISNFPRVNSENNIYHEKNISFKINNNAKIMTEKNYSPQNNRFNNNFYLNPNQFSNIKNNNEEKKTKIIFNNINNINNINNNSDDMKKTELKKIHIIKNNNNNIPGKIIKISPSKNIMNNNCSNINNNNKYFKINQITIINTDNNKDNQMPNLSNKPNINRTNENLKYNTYNTYNTFNSYNNTLDKTNNIINHFEYIDNNKITSNKRINHILYHKNNYKTSYNNYQNNCNTNYNISDINLKNGSPNDNNQQKIIYLNKYNVQNDVHSVNINRNNINQNLIMNNFHHRKTNSADKETNNYPKPILGPDGNIRKNIKNIELIKKRGNANINKMNSNSRINITNIKFKPSNSTNNINRYDNLMRQNANNANNKINVTYINNNNNNKYRNEADNVNINAENSINNNYCYKSGNNNTLKRIVISNNNNIPNKMNNNNYIRLDKTKNNPNNLQKVLNNYNSKINNSSNKKNNGEIIIPKYNNYKKNSLKKLQNNNKVFLKRAFPPYKYQTENDSHSVLIHKNNNNNAYIVNNNKNNSYTNNNIKINNNINNTNINTTNYMSSVNSISTSRNDNKLSSNFTSIKNNSNPSKIYGINYSERHVSNDNPLFTEIESKIINNSTRGNTSFNNNNINNKENENNIKKEENSYNDKKFKTEDIEIDYSDSFNKNDINKMNRINKYKMIRYKGSKNQ